MLELYIPLLPLLVHRLGLNYTMVGSLVALGSMSSSFSQPLFGLLSDRLSRPWFVAAGPLVAAVFLSSIGAAPTYAALVALLVAGGIGVAAFHPQTASLAGTSTASRGMAMSFWVTGGTLGWALGPMFATQTARVFGLERTRDRGRARHRALARALSSGCGTSRRSRTRRGNRRNYRNSRPSRVRSACST